MVPTALVVLDEIPLTPVGKLDRRALPAPDFTSGAGSFRSPRSATEHTVAQIFADILGLDRVGIDESFFEVGGNSLSATKLVSRVNAALGTDLGVRAIFEAPTVAALSSTISAVSTSRGSRPILTAVERPETVPVSFAQQRMWFINQFDTTSPAYNVPLAIRLTGVLDVGALRHAVADVIERHESLRTVFPTVDGRPTQVVVSGAEVAPDLHAEPVSDEAGLRTRIVALAETGFDVAAQVPLRIQLFRLSEDEHVLAVVVHHICADGSSMAPLARDVVLAYTDRSHGAEPNQSPLAVQYIDYTLWQERLLGNAEDPDSIFAQQLTYWSTQLAGLPDVIQLPTDRPRPPERSFRGGRVAFTIAPDLHRRIVEVSRDHDSTVFMTLHAALAIVLGRHAGTEDVAVGTAISGRGDAALDDVVGMFVNTLVLRTTVDPGASFQDLLEHVRETDLAAYGHADVPFERLVEELNPTRSSAYSPLFQVALGLQNVEQARVELPGLTVEAIDFDVTVAKADLDFMLSEEFHEGEPAGLTASIDFATDLYDRQTVEHFADRFVRVLDAAAAQPDRAVGDIELLADDERSMLSPVHGKPPMPVALWPDMLAEAVAMNPDGTALVFGADQLTYRELDARSNQLARLLTERGVGPESVVALAMSRSIESVLAVWAVTKSGAAFVPVDPSYPVDRIDHMLNDSGAVVGLTKIAHVLQLPAVLPWLVLDDTQFAGRSTGRRRLRSATAPGPRRYARPTRRT